MSGRARWGIGPTIRPWIGLFAPPAAWYGCQQGMGWVLHLGCAYGGPPLGPLVGAAAFLACAAAGWIAWPVARRPVSEPHARARWFIAGVAMGGAALFGLATAYQTLAMILVPPCAR